MQPLPLFNSRTFSRPPKETPYPFRVTPHSPSPQTLATINLFSVFLSICLFWTFHIYRIMQHVVFGVWLPSLSIMFSRFIHVVAYISISLLFFFKINLFIYLWLSWVFVAARRLSLVVASGGYSSLRCAGFSLQWLLLSWNMGFRCIGFSSCGLQVLEHRLSSCGTWA